MKLVVPYIGPFDFIAVRYLSGAVVLFSILVATGRPHAALEADACRRDADHRFQGFVQTALISGGVGKVSLMAYTMPFWVVLFAWALQGERPTAPLGRHRAGRERPGVLSRALGRARRSRAGYGIVPAQERLAPVKRRTKTERGQGFNACHGMANG